MVVKTKFLPSKRTPPKDGKKIPFTIQGREKLLQKRGGKELTKTERRRKEKGGAAAESGAPQTSPLFLRFSQFRERTFSAVGSYARSYLIDIIPTGVILFFSLIWALRIGSLENQGKSPPFSFLFLFFSEDSYSSMNQRECLTDGCETLCYLDLNLLAPKKKKEELDSIFYPKKKI